MGGAVLLWRLAPDHDWQTGGERPGGRKRDRPELRPREPRRVRLEFRDGSRDSLPECGEQVGPRLEAVFVEVVVGALARSKEEIAFEIGVFAQRELQLVVGQVPRALPRISRASGSSRSAPGEPFVSESIEPSSK